MIQMTLRRKTLWQRVKRDKILLLMLLPCFVYLLTFRYIPMYGVTLAFREQNPANIFGGRWVGFDNFKFFFQYMNAWQLIGNTLLINIYGLLLFPCPMILALMFNEVQIKGLRKSVQTISYVPYFISTVVVVSIMLQMLSPTTGAVNKLIVACGGEPIYFWIKPQWFRFLYLASEQWQRIGWNTIVYVAALSGVDTQLYEAAVMDGAGRWKQLWKITLPAIQGVAVLMLIMSFGSMLSSNTEKVLLMQNDMNMATSDVLGSFLYRVGLRESNFSLGAAIDFMNSVLSITLTLMVNQIAKKCGDTSLF